MICRRRGYIHISVQFNRNKGRLLQEKRNVDKFGSSLQEGKVSTQSRLVNQAAAADAL